MHKLRKKAEEKERTEEAVQKPVPDPIKGVKQTAFQNKVREYAQLHRSEVFRSEIEQPERFRDLLASQGDFDMTDFLVHGILSGSNFAGHSIHHSNYRTFLRLYGDLPGVLKISGGHESFGVAVRLASFTKDLLKTFVEMDEYASLDDEEASRIEVEAIDEAWASWARFDFISALEREFEDKEDEIDLLTDEDVKNLFEVCRQRIGAEWVHETGNSAFIDVHRIAAACEAEDLPLLDDKDEADEE